MTNEPHPRHPRFLAVGSALVLCALALAPGAYAQTIALTSVRGAGNQVFTGALGMDFDVLNPAGIVVTRLGAFDDGQNGFANAISVGIFNRTTGTLVPGLSATLTTANTAPVGQSRFFDIVDALIGPGSYSIVAQGYGASELNGNAGAGFGGTAPTISTGGGDINFVGVGRYSFTPSLVYPTALDGGPANRYDAGTFEFRSVTVPEPGSLGLLAVGLISAGGLTIRRRRRN